MKLRLLVLLLLVGVTSCRSVEGKRQSEVPRSVQNAPSVQAKTPKSLILVIGDGMGPGPVSLLLQARPEGAMATLMKEGTVGLVDVTPFGALVTDSAAGGTALSTGVQTRPRMVAVDPDGNKVETILEAAKRLGKATGVVTTSDLTDATPAAFLSHGASRYGAKEFAEQMKQNPPTIAIGGGGQWFPKDSEVFLTQAPGDMPFMLYKRTSLVELTKKALSTLEDSPSGYVLMIEAAHIDKACHANNAPALFAEMIDLDNALEELRSVVASGDVLLVITADHDTGGFGFQYRRDSERASGPTTLASGETWSPGADFGDLKDLETLQRGETPPSITWSTRTHTSANVHVIAVGPGAEAFGGLHHQWEIGRLLKEISLGKSPQ